MGYERITGIRLPGQRPDGTFTVSKSKTVATDAGLLRDALLDDASRADLFPDQESQLRSKPASKAIRLGIGGGIAVLSVEPMKDGRSKVFIEHTKLPSPDVADEWRFYWGEWLDALDDA